MKKNYATLSCVVFNGKTRLERVVVEVTDDKGGILYGHFGLLGGALPRRGDALQLEWQGQKIGVTVTGTDGFISFESPLAHWGDLPEAPPDPFPERAC
jgi:hypothetical protein